MRFSLKGQDAYRRGQALEWMFLTARRVAIDLSRKKKTAEPVDETQPARDRWGRKSDDPTQLHRMALAEAGERDERVLGDCLRKLEQTKPAHARLVRAMLTGISQRDACAAEKFDMDKCYHVKSEAIKLLRLCVKGAVS